MINIKGFIYSKVTLFVGWLISYVLVLCIPIVIGTFVYVQAIGIINDEINATHLASLNQVKTFVDNRLEDIDRMFVEMTLNKKVNSIMYYPTPIQSYQKYTIIELQDDLRKFVVSNQYIDNIFIYFQKNEFILSDRGTYPEDQFEFTNSQYFGVTQEQWVDLIHAEHSEYRIIRSKSPDRIVSNKIFCVKPLPSMNSNTSKATLLVIMNETKFDEVFQKLESPLKDSDILVIDNENHRLFNNEKNMFLSGLKYEEIIKASTSFYDRSGKSEVAITHISSDLTGWSFIKAIPSAVYLNKIQHVKVMVYLYVLLCIVIGGIISYLLARKNYNPIKRILKLVQEHSQNSKDKHYDEIKLIELSLIYMLNKNKTMESRLQLENEVIRNNFFNRLIKGKIRNEQEIIEFCEKYNIHFESDHYVILLLGLDEEALILPDSTPDVDEGKIDLLYFAVKNISEELVNVHHKAYMAELDGMTVCLINILNIDPIIIKDEMVETATQIKTTFEEYFKVDLTIGISNIHDNFAGIVECYREVLELLEYKQLLQDSTPIYYKQIQPIKDKSGTYDSENKEQKIYNCIKCQDYQGAILCLNEMIDGDYFNGAYSLPVIRYKIFGLINGVIHAIGDVRSEYNEEFVVKLDASNRLLSTKNITELKQQMNEILIELSNYYTDKNTSMKVNKIKETIEYINKYFTDTEISITRVAEVSNMNPSYLSRVFKQKMGVGFLDYVHELRIQKAKKLMKSSDISIKDIAIQVGFYNDVAFIRSFKRYEGITPGKFREMQG